jgi:hypothetical protein
VLGSGFLAANPDLCNRVQAQQGALTDFFGQLLRLVYRLIFLLAAEDRNLLHHPDASPAVRRLYAQGYSLASLRDRAVRRTAWDAHHDKWEGLAIVFAALTTGEPHLGLPALGGLFASEMTPDLDVARLPNRALMEAIFRLAWLREDAALLPVNWRDMETEELGSVYESLLELIPRLTDDGRGFSFAEGGEARGHARKTTGSYYTPDALVQTLLDSALDPVLDRVEAESDDPAVALLGVTVIDPACGSGHFLLAAGRRIATRLARARTGGVAAAEDYRHALRDVARACLHGVDRNPLAVELTKVALWVETVEPGKPLGFLDANIRCGDALLGVFDLKVLADGVPDAAYKPLTGDDKATARYYATRNRQERGKQGRLDFMRGGGTLRPEPLAKAWAGLRALPEDSTQQVAEKQRRFGTIREDRLSYAWGEAADLYIAAFLLPKQGGEPPLGAAPMLPTSGDVWRALADKQVHPPLAARVVEASRAARAFHWSLEYPDVMDAGGFDVVLGNPPWERIKLQEQEFFAARDPEIAEAPNAAVRGRLIAALAKAAPGTPEFALHEAFETAKRLAEATSVFVRESGRFALTGRGDVNTYALFAEHFANSASARGRAGVIVPTGIATDATTAPFFSSLIDGKRLARLIDFENRDAIFPAVHRSYKFSLLTIGHGIEEARFVFFLTDAAQLAEPERQFTLSAADIARINPNTKTAPVFRTRADAELTAKIYARVPVLIEEARGASGNPWGVRFMAMFHMANDSNLFRTAAQLRDAGFARDGSDWVHTAERYVSLYEAKMIHQFDHRWATYDGTDSRDVTTAERQEPAFEPTPRYWVPEIDVEDRLSPLPKEYLSALRTENVRLVSLLVSQFLFALWLIREGYPDRATETWKIFDEWKAFVSLHPGLRRLAPTSIGLAGENPALMQPTSANCLPAAPVDAIVNTERTKTAWYEADIQSIATLTRLAQERAWMKEPEASLADESAVLAFGEWMRTASCPKWLTGWRDIARSTDERTVIATAFPHVGCGDTLLLLFPSAEHTRRSPCLIGNLCSLILDYSARQKIGGTHLKYNVFKQLPVLSPAAYSEFDVTFIVPRVLELTYTSRAMAPFASDLGYNGPPFSWDEDRRAVLRAELDAFYARAYGLSRDELRYILDPEDAMGPGYPSETFRVLKQNEKRRFGEYRTARLVLAAWDAQVAAQAA